MISNKGLQTVCTNTQKGVSNGALSLIFQPICHLFGYGKMSLLLFT